MNKYLSYNMDKMIKENSREKTISVTTEAQFTVQQDGKWSGNIQGIPFCLCFPMSDQNSSIIELNSHFQTHMNNQEDVWVPGGTIQDRYPTKDIYKHTWTIKSDISCSWRLPNNRANFFAGISNRKSERCDRTSNVSSKQTFHHNQQIQIGETKCSTFQVRVQEWHQFKDKTNQWMSTLS